MKAPLVRYRLNEFLETILIEAAHRHGAKLRAFKQNLGEDLDNIETECDLIVIECPTVPDPTEVIRLRQWCLANPSHSLISIFQSADQHDSDAELSKFIDDFGFADSSR